MNVASVRLLATCCPVKGLSFGLHYCILFKVLSCIPAYVYLCQTFFSERPESVNAWTISFKGRPTLCILYISPELDGSFCDEASPHGAHRCARGCTAYWDTWQIFFKLLDDKSGKKERYKKTYYCDCEQHVNDTGCFRRLYYLVRLSACILATCLCNIASDYIVVFLLVNLLLYIIKLLYTLCLLRITNYDAGLGCFETKYDIP